MLLRNTSPHWHGITQTQNKFYGIQEMRGVIFFFLRKMRQKLWRIGQLMQTSSFTPDIFVLIIFLKGIMVILCHLFFSLLNGIFRQEFCTSVKMLIGDQPFLFCPNSFLSHIGRPVPCKDMRKYSLKYRCLHLSELESTLNKCNCPIVSQGLLAQILCQQHEVVFKETLILGVIFYVHTARSSRYNTCFRVQYGIEPEPYSTMGNICMASVQAGSKFSDVLVDSGRVTVGYQISYLQEDTTRFAHLKIQCRF